MIKCASFQERPLMSIFRIEGMRFLITAESAENFLDVTTKVLIGRHSAFKTWYDLLQYAAILGFEENCGAFFLNKGSTFSILEVKSRATL